MITKTGLVATLGPVSDQEAFLQKFIKAGVTTFRMNFSHGTEQTHGTLLQEIRRATAHFSHQVAVVGDLCGPKIRVGQIEGGSGLIEEGARIRITSKSEPGRPDCFSTTYPQFVHDVVPGHRILINDGVLVFRVEDKDSEGLLCRVFVGGEISSRKGINLPDTQLGIPAITERDWKWVDWAIEQELDYLALSFVQDAEEIRMLKQYLESKASRIKVIAKIEKPRAVENIEAICRETDAVLVARGDLGVEMDLAEVPLVQKRITNMCRTLGKPVIVATQVLQSMIENSSPTRAEVSDIANAVMDYTDAVMLSGETAVGKYPLEAVRVMRHVCGKTEQFLDSSDQYRPLIETADTFRDEATIARTVAQMLDDIECDLVVAGTLTGNTARLLSKSRIDVPIIALCPDPVVGRQMSIHYGLFSLSCPMMNGLEEFVQFAEKTVLEHDYTQPGRRILLLPGRNLLAEQANHALILRTIPEE